MIDHLVYATTDLEATVAELASRLGVEPTPGGSHAGQGTRNQLVGLGAGAYLEIIGPDDDQPDPVDGRPFGIDRLVRPRLVGWCVRPRLPLAAVARAAAAARWDVGPIQAMSRTRPDGVELSWHLTMPIIGPTAVAPLPFLIDWGTSPHPADTLDHPVQLLDLRIECTAPEALAGQLEAIDELTSVELIDAPVVRLSALLDTPGGPLGLS